MKRTISIQKPSKLKMQLNQLLIEQEGKVAGSIPMEDLGVIVLEHPQISVTHAVFGKALEFNTAIITCNEFYHPVGLLLPLEGHSKQRKMFEAQLMASEPLKKQLWQDVVSKKLANQARVMESQQAEKALYIKNLSTQVKSGDSENREAQGAAYYWRHLFGAPLQRERGGAAPNSFLNYGYAILRAMTARALVSAGMLPTWGIHHRNQYNAYCLADDMMEAYRPMVDQKVLEIYTGEVDQGLTTEVKSVFWKMAQWDTKTSTGIRPLELALGETASSLQKSFVTKQRKLVLADVVSPP